jgi:hypothetical protein
VPDSEGRLFAADIAADLGISASTWLAYASRGQVVGPVAKVIDGSHVRPVWDPQDYAEYKARRRDRQESDS